MSINVSVFPSLRLSICLSISTVYLRTFDLLVRSTVEKDTFQEVIQPP